MSNFNINWSLAPFWANYWVAIADELGHICGGMFIEDEPKLINGLNESAYIYNGKSKESESFGYSGSWEQSVTKRS